MLIEPLTRRATNFARIIQVSAASCTQDAVQIICELYSYILLAALKAAPLFSTLYALPIITNNAQ